MTVITDMEALEAVPTGAVVTLTNQSNALWQRTPNGFTRSGVEVDPQHLLMEVQNGAVHLGAVPEVGSLWRDRHGYYRYLLRSVATDDGTRWYSLCFYEDGALYGEQNTIEAGNWGTPVVEGNHPEWYTLAFRSLLSAYRGKDQTMVRVEAQYTAAQETMTQERTELRRLQREVRNSSTVDRSSFDEGLREWFSEATLTDTELRDLNAVLDDHGFASLRETENVDVTVTVNGQTYFTVDRDLVEQYVGGNVSDFDEDQVRIDWTKDLTFEVEVPDGECGCDQVTTAMVEARLREADLTWGDFDHETECEND